MKFGQLMKYNKRNIFFQKPCREWDRETSSRSLFVFLKNFYMRGKKVVGSLKYDGLLKIWHNRNKLHKTLDWWSSNATLIFWKKSLGIVSPPYFVYDCSIKMFLMLYLLTHQIRFSDCPISWDIGKEMYCNFLLTKLWCHKFQYLFYLCNQAVFLHDQKQ